MTNIDLVLGQAFELPTLRPEWEDQLLATLERFEGSLARDPRPFHAIAYGDRPFPLSCYV